MRCQETVNLQIIVEMDHTTNNEFDTGTTHIFFYVVFHQTVLIY